MSSSPDRPAGASPPWQATVVPPGTVHCTRAIGRTDNATFEKQHAQVVFVAPPASARSARIE
jgi:hypothetical protein